MSAVELRVDEPYCPKCSLRMKLVRVEPLPAHATDENQASGNSYVYRCDCGEEIEKYSVGAQ
jgi:hypothetical protein